jgi:hypothetical protein
MSTNLISVRDEAETKVWDHFCHLVHPSIMRAYEAAMGIESAPEAS